MSTTCVVVSQKGNRKAAMALSSLIHALYELDNYILARLVTKKDKPPVMMVMAPLIEPEFEALIDVQACLPTCYQWILVSRSLIPCRYPSLKMSDNIDSRR